jgi:hypothetical protein
MEGSEDNGAEQVHEDRWEREFEDFTHKRLDRVQAAARAWLSVLATLLALLGSVVLIKGGSLITGITSSHGYRIALLVLVTAVFAAAILAVIGGGAATWGGLSDPSDDAERKVLRRETYRLWRVLSFPVLVFDLTWLRTVPDKKGGEKKDEKKEAWERFRDKYQWKAIRRRDYLHASRTLGVITAVLIGAVAVVAVFAGTFAPAPPDVIVVHNGRVSCGPVSTVQRYAGVTQVTSVNNC